MYQNQQLLRYSVSKEHHNTGLSKNLTSFWLQKHGLNPFSSTYWIQVWRTWMVNKGQKTQRPRKQKLLAYYCFPKPIQETQTRGMRENLGAQEKMESSCFPHWSCSLPTCAYPKRCRTGHWGAWTLTTQEKRQQCWWHQTKTNFTWQCFAYLSSQLGHNWRRWKWWLRIPVYIV